MRSYSTTLQNSDETSDLGTSQ